MTATEGSATEPPTASAPHRYRRSSPLDGPAPAEGRDPYIEYARLRQQSPVVRHPSAVEGAPPGFLLYRRKDVTQVLRDGSTFSSSVIAAGMAEVWGRKIIVGMDAPEHQRHRALVSTAFRRTTLARWEDSLVARVVHELIDQFIDRGQSDLVGDFTFGFPSKVIAGVLGLPEQDYRRFQEWAIGIINITTDWPRAVKCSQELRQYLTGIVDARRHDPRDDLITDLVTAELDGEKLDDEEIYSFLRMLLPAGIETTYRSSGNLLYLLLTHPDQLAALKADRGLIPQAIEEGLRLETPVLITVRVATRATSVSGVEIPPGSSVVSMLGSANRDPEGCDDPETFDIFRSSAAHLSFGTGPHLCLGMHLARMETRVALNALLDRLDDVHLDVDEAERVDAHIHGDSMFRCPTSLPVLWSRP